MANEPPKTFEMDGTEHTVGDPDCCSTMRTWDKCPKCNGQLHFQGVFGGYFHECEICHEKF